MAEIKIRETYFYETHFLDFYKKLKPEVQKKVYGHLN